MRKSDLNTSNCTARNDVQQHNTHDPVKHLDPVMSHWKTHLKSYEVYEHADRHCASGLWYSEESLRRCWLHFQLSITSRLGNLCIAMSASSSRDSVYTQVWAIRTHMAEIGRQGTYMVSASASSECCRRRSTEENHNLCTGGS